MEHVRSRRAEKVWSRHDVEWLIAREDDDVAEWSFVIVRFRVENHGDVIEHRAQRGRLSP